MAFATHFIDDLGAVEFDTEVFEAEELTDLADLATGIMAVDGRRALSALPGLDQITTRSYSPREAVDEVRRQVEAGIFMPELVAEAEAELGRKLSTDDIMEGVLENVERSVRGEIDAEARAAAETSGARVVQREGRLMLEVQGEVVLRTDAGGPFGVSKQRLLAIVVVMIDLAQVVLAFISFHATVNKSTVSKATKHITKHKAPVTELIGVILSVLKDIIGSVQAAGSKKKMAKAVENTALDIAKAFFVIFVYAARKVANVFIDLIKLFIADWKDKLAAGVCLTGSILAWTGSAGAVLAASVISLAMAVVDLLVDCITLSRTA